VTDMKKKLPFFLIICLLFTTPAFAGIKKQDEHRGVKCLIGSGVCAASLIAAYCYSRKASGAQKELDALSQEVGDAYESDSRAALIPVLERTISRSKTFRNILFGLFGVSGVYAGYQGIKWATEKKKKKSNGKKGGSSGGGKKLDPVFTFLRHDKLNDSGEIERSTFVVSMKDVEMPIVAYVASVSLDHERLNEVEARLKLHVSAANQTCDKGEARAMQTSSFLCEFSKRLFAEKQSNPQKSTTTPKDMMFQKVQIYSPDHKRITFKRDVVLWFHPRRRK